MKFGMIKVPAAIIEVDFKNFLRDKLSIFRYLNFIYLVKYEPYMTF